MSGIGKVTVSCGSCSWAMRYSDGLKTVECLNPKCTQHGKIYKAPLIQLEEVNEIEELEATSILNAVPAQ